MWVFKGAALLAVCAALAIDESDLKSGTAFELSNALLQEHKVCTLLAPRRLGC